MAFKEREASTFQGRNISALLQRQTSGEDVDGRGDEEAGRTLQDQWRVTGSWTSWLGAVNHNISWTDL